MWSLRRRGSVSVSETIGAPPSGACVDVGIASWDQAEVTTTPRDDRATIMDASTGIVAGRMGILLIDQDDIGT
jgi:hypothetical protein